MPKRPERKRMRLRTGAASSVGGILVKAIANFDTATLYEAAGQQGAMVPEIRPLARGTRMAGPALPVACPPGVNPCFPPPGAMPAPEASPVARAPVLKFGLGGEWSLPRRQAR